ncbi:MAG TPA: type I phosphomannose isomerase catalytic subunit [Terriglobia bacterium]|nr:type I phosphomannose isomerase catalytic subunit [Terriglobia bacterium]
MPQLDSPLLLAPVFKPKIWGRVDLAPLFDHPDAPKTLRRRRSHAPGARLAPSPVNSELPPIGEVWLTDDTSRFLNGPVADMTLAEACTKYGSNLLGDWGEPRFPILAKYLFTSDWLSVQVHPDDDYAARHEPGNLGKCEMWYVVSAQRGASYLLGAKPGVTLDKLKKSSEHGKSKEMLNPFHPQAGEAIYLCPGTVHALGPGLVVFEAEQNSDLTYRLDDFGRVGLDGKPRPLHWDKAADVIQTDLTPHHALPLVRLKEPFGMRRYVLASSKFAVEELGLRRPASFSGSPHRVELLAIVDGRGRVETPAGWLGYRTGQTWLIPPAAKRFRLVPGEPTRLFRVYVPNLESDFRRPLEKHRVRAATIRRICFD